LNSIVDCSCRMNAKIKKLANDDIVKPFAVATPAKSSLVFCGRYTLIRTLRRLSCSIHLIYTHYGTITREGYCFMRAFSLPCWFHAQEEYGHGWSKERICAEELHGPREAINQPAGLTQGTFTDH